MEFKHHLRHLVKGMNQQNIITAIAKRCRVSQTITYVLFTLRIKNCTVKKQNISPSRITGWLALLNSRCAVLISATTGSLVFSRFLRCLNSPCMSLRATEAENKTGYLADMEHAGYRI